MLLWSFVIYFDSALTHCLRKKGHLGRCSHLNDILKPQHEWSYTFWLLFVGTPHGVRSAATCMLTLSLGNAEVTAVG